jgi:cold shock CspA family protein
MVYNQAYEGVVDKVMNGFGFVRVQGFKKGIFFHHSAIQNGSWQDIEEGLSVIIEEVIDEPKGTMAKKVTLQ